MTSTESNDQQVNVGHNERRTYMTVPVLNFTATSDEDAARQIKAAEKALQDMGVDAVLDDEMYRYDDADEPQPWSMPSAPAQGQENPSEEGC